MTMKPTLFLAAALLAGGAAAQHAGHAGHGGHGGHGGTGAQGAQAPAKPYAGMQSREIKALSPQDMQGLLQGQGMSLALAAELNGYPGPTHVLELAAPLGLSPEQRARTEALMQRHKAQAQALGARVVEAERRLDEAFAGRSIDAALLERLTAEIAAAQAQLRAEHLRTHLEQTALLTPGQIDHYAALRGYRSPR